MFEIGRFHWNLARTFFFLTSIWAVVGICCNSLIFLTTLKTKSLRGTYNIFIAICAVADVVHQCGTLVQLPLLFDVQLEIDSDICTMIMFLPEMGIAIGGACVLCIGIDRMVSVIFAIRYRTLKKRYYHIFLASLIIAYCCALCFLMIAFYRRRIALCEIGTPYPDMAIMWFGMGNLSVALISAIVYGITWIGLRLRADSSSMHRIFKSLLIIVCVDVSGGVATPALCLIFHLLHLEAQQIFAWIYLGTMFINFSLAVKLFIYYSTSSEYRDAFNALLFKRSLSTSCSESSVMKTKCRAIRRF